LRPADERSGRLRRARPRGHAAAGRSGLRRASADRPGQPGRGRRRLEVHRRSAGQVSERRGHPADRTQPGQRLAEVERLATGSDFRPSWKSENRTMLKTGRVALLAVGTIWLAWSPVQALSPAPDSLDDALALLQTDPPAAVVALEVLVAAGDAEATASLASALDIAGGDPERSERLWAQALRDGSQNARLNIGMRRLANDDPAADAEAVTWLKGLDEMYQPAAAYPL